MVTWGVFPGQEIIQPTFVGMGSFLAWKDEAFLYWKLWSEIYKSDSLSRKVLSGIESSWFLVNLVDNNFKSSNDLFRLLAGASKI